MKKKKMKEYNSENLELLQIIDKFQDFIGKSNSLFLKYKNFYYKNSFDSSIADFILSETDKEEATKLLLEFKNHISEAVKSIKLIDFYLKNKIKKLSKDDIETIDNEIDYITGIYSVNNYSFQLFNDSWAEEHIELLKDSFGVFNSIITLLNEIIISYNKNNSENELLTPESIMKKFIFV